MSIRTLEKRKPEILQSPPTGGLHLLRNNFACLGFITKAFIPVQSIIPQNIQTCIKSDLSISLNVYQHILHADISSLKVPQRQVTTNIVTSYNKKITPSLILFQLVIIKSYRPFMSTHSRWSSELYNSRFQYGVTESA